MSNNTLHDALRQLGLDDRYRDGNGETRLKNGATKAKTLAKEDPVFGIFSPEARLTNLRRYYGVRSEEQLRKVAIIKGRAQKLQGK